MTGEDLEYELERNPFISLRLHLVSAKTFDVPVAGMAWVLQNAIFVLRDPRGDSADLGYDVIALRNIERIEQLVDSKVTGQ